MKSNVVRGRGFKFIFALVLVWVAWVNLLSWQATFFGAPDIGFSPLARFVDKVSGSALANWYIARSGLQSEDVLEQLVFQGGGAVLKTAVGTEEFFSSIDSLGRTSGSIDVRGWVFLRSNTDSVRFIVAVEGDSVSAVASVRGFRSDVAEALGDTRAKFSGFEFAIPVDDSVHKCELKFFALAQSLRMYRIQSKCPASDSVRAN